MPPFGGIPVTQMKDLTKVFRSLDPTWSAEVSATPNAEKAVLAAQRDLRRSKRSLWREVASALLDLQREFGPDPWFTSQTLHWFQGIAAGDPESHPELLPPVRFDFLAKWVPDAIVIGTAEDFRLPRHYMRARLLNEIAAVARDSEPWSDIRK